jgi:hypothetical protein
MREAVIAALGVLAGAVLGALLNHYSSRSLRLEGDLAGYRYDTYRDFIQVMFADYEGNADVLDTVGERRWDAFRRVSVFSSAETVSAVAAFNRTTHTYKPCEKDLARMRADLRIYQSIRDEVHRGSERVDDDTLAAVLFACGFSTHDPISSE